MVFRIEPLSAELWPDLATLFGPSGACYGCWCTHFRLPAKLRNATSSDGRKAVMQSRVEGGPPPGLLGYLDDQTVAWMQIGPRADVPQWNNPGRVTTPLEDAPPSDSSVWAISCFFFKSSARGKGFSHNMVAAGIAYARDHDARLLEACPMDRAKQSKSVGLFVGSTSVFAKAGFEHVALRKPCRPLMRLHLIPA
jgi:predicted GNAT family acetyltransferase